MQASTADKREQNPCNPAAGLEQLDGIRMDTIKLHLRDGHSFDVKLTVRGRFPLGNHHNDKSSRQIDMLAHVAQSSARRLRKFIRVRKSADTCAEHALTTPALTWLSSVPLDKFVRANLNVVHTASEGHENHAV